MTFEHRFVEWLYNGSPVKFGQTVIDKNTLRNLILKWFAYVEPIYREIDDLNDEWTFNFQQVIVLQIKYVRYHPEDGDHPTGYKIANITIV